MDHLVDGWISVEFDLDCGISGGTHAKDPYLQKKGEHYYKYLLLQSYHWYHKSRTRFLGGTALKAHIL